MQSNIYIQKIIEIKRNNNLKYCNNKTNILKIKLMNYNQGSDKNNFKLID